MSQIHAGAIRLSLLDRAKRESPGLIRQIADIALHQFPRHQPDQNRGTHPLNDCRIDPSQCRVADQALAIAGRPACPIRVANTCNAAVTGNRFDPPVLIRVGWINRAVYPVTRIDRVTFNNGILDWDTRPVRRLDIVNAPALLSRDSTKRDNRSAIGELTGETRPLVIRVRGYVPHLGDGVRVVSVPVLQG